MTLEIDSRWLPSDIEKTQAFRELLPEAQAAVKKVMQQNATPEVGFDIGDLKPVTGLISANDVSRLLDGLSPPLERRREVVEKLNDKGVTDLVRLSENDFLLLSPKERAAVVKEIAGWKDRPALLSFMADVALGVDPNAVFAANRVLFIQMLWRLASSADLEQADHMTALLLKLDPAIVAACIPEPKLPGPRETPDRTASLYPLEPFLTYKASKGRASNLAWFLAHGYNDTKKAAKLALCLENDDDQAKFLKAFKCEAEYTAFTVSFRHPNVTKTLAWQTILGSQKATEILALRLATEHPTSNAQAEKYISLLLDLDQSYVPKTIDWADLLARVKTPALRAKLLRRLPPAQRPQLSTPNVSVREKTQRPS